ncbi:DUF805 domain-containing protein [Neolewinella aurantiaca]|uniref:DUF805 domain-containing protein n=1 Tax=Neolewinella aurantiaca TaxID=2602767 RepID=A0A5C7FML8_9BACT|nr:DUF805 domain-containing protein [Neolewinella aurantiaca]TXF91372.1 DUF805 domain-containing protein [Neolewinella aurantiaca]
MIWNNFILALNNAFKLNGRSRRAEFWSFALVSGLFGMVASFWDGVFFEAEVLENMLEIAFFIPSIAVSTRRLHDVNRSGWWQLIAFTGIGLFVLLYWYAKDSDIHSNDYGVGPKYGHNTLDDMVSDTYSDDQIV